MFSLDVLQSGFTGCMCGMLNKLLFRFILVCLSQGYFMMDRDSHVRSHNVRMHNMRMHNMRSHNVRSNMNWCISMHHWYFRVVKFWFSMVDGSNMMNDGSINVMDERSIDVMNEGSFDVMDWDSNMRVYRYIMMNHCFNHMRLLGMDGNVRRCNNMGRDCVMHGNSVMSSNWIQNNSSMMRRSNNIVFL